MFGLNNITFAAGGILVLALVTIGTHDYFQTQTIARLNRSIGQLQGAVTIQNDSINNFKGLADAALKRSQAAQKAAAAQAALDHTTIAALLAKPLQSDPVLACKAADALILEYAK